MPPNKKQAGAIGVHHGKRDLERVGLFAETGWLHGAPYVSPHGYEFREGGTKGRQMLPGASKTKVGLQDCYFDKGPYKRIFEKEAYSSSVRENYLASMASSKKNVSGNAFVAGAASKKHSTPGDFHGTFGGKIAAMSRQEKARPPYKSEPRNILTNPGKKGTYGFLDITFNKFPRSMPDPYQSRQGLAEASRRLLLHGPFVPAHASSCFDNNPWKVASPASVYVRRPEVKPGFRGAVWIPPHFPKRPGNNHDGCFSKFPPHKPEKFKDAFRIIRGSQEPNVFYPQIQGKSMYTASVVNSNIDFRVNAKNWRTFQPVTFKFNALTNQ